MDEFPMDDYFVPLTEHSDVESYADLDNDSDYGTCSPQFYDSTFNACGSSTKKSSRGKKSKSKATRQKRLEADEAGLTMMLKQSERPKRPEEVRKLPAKFEDVVSPSPAVPLDCCHHREPGGRRKFVISFGANNASVTNDCLINERNRCQDFWKFIDSHPNLLELIRDGEFVHSSAPHLAIAPFEQRTKLTIKQTKKNGEILRAKNKELHDAEKERKLKRKIVLDELQKKSGQVVYIRKPETETKSSKQKNKTGGSMKESFKEIMKEMKIFDKFCGNPVSIGPWTDSRASTAETLERAMSNTTLVADDEAEE